MLIVGCVLTMWLPVVYAQQAATAAAASTWPDPIYWRQNLFLIPYQWSATAEPGGAESVWLYMSKDRGATWQKISEARPQVRAFNYHAEADGEYWFAIRTTDARGGFWPAGPLQPELRVIVDTTIPRVEVLSGVIRDDSTIEIDWRVEDVNLDVSLRRVEVQMDRADDWQVLTLPPQVSNGPAVAQGHARVQLPAPGRPTAIRFTATDMAGNRAVSQTDVSRVAVGRVAADRWPTVNDGRGGDGPATMNDSAVAAGGNGDDAGWVASTTPTGGVSSEFVSFGGQSLPQRTVDDHRAERHAPFVPLEPFRQRTQSPSDSTFHSAAAPDRAASVTTATDIWPAGSTGADVDPWLWLSGPDVTVPAGTTPKLVSSRTFSLEYELQAVGPWGVAKVELWGTRDGGQTWRSYARDDDHTSPLQVTVSGEGLYGFRIIVSGGGGVGGFPPQPGDQPELWVGVDSHRPEIELTAAEPASGELAGHLWLRWWADDDNLERRPIGLFYSSRPAGPWTAIATNLENTGEYPWRLERHLPPRIYLRLEARDTAGNLAAYQTYEPVSIELPPPAGRIHSVESLDGPTARSGAASPH